MTYHPASCRCPRCQIQRREPIETLPLFDEARPPLAPGVEPVDVVAAWQEYFDGRSPEEVCRDEVNAAVWRAADASVGTPDVGTRQWLEWRADEDARHGLHLETIRFAHAAGVELRPWIANARRIARPVTWAEIADVLGVSRQSAHERYAPRGDALDGDAAAPVAQVRARQEALEAHGRLDEPAFVPADGFYLRPLAGEHLCDRYDCTRPGRHTAEGHFLPGWPSGTVSAEILCTLHAAATLARWQERIAAGLEKSGEVCPASRCTTCGVDWPVCWSRDLQEWACTDCGARP